MNIEDLIYLKHRVEEELDFAQAAEDPVTARAHYALACLYLGHAHSAESHRPETPAPRPYVGTGRFRLESWAKTE